MVRTPPRRSLAEYNLGSAYNHGQGVTQSDGQAAVWYRKAAEQGNANAEFFLGGMYALGKGVPQDFSEAYFWLDLALAGKLDSDKQKAASDVRDTVASFLTPAELTRVQKRARLWFESHSKQPQK